MRHALVFLLISITGGCATTDTPYEPFKVDQEEIGRRVDSVGLVPCVIPDDIVEHEAKRKEFESYLIKKMRDAGFSMVPSSEYQEVFLPMKAAVGPLYDPNTGDLLKEKKETLTRHVRTEYLNEHDVDALLRCGVVVVKASWNHNHVSWHGTTAASTGKKGFWANLSAPSAYGTIPALSFRVSLEDRKGDDYYVNYGGIQLLRWVSGMKFKPVPINQLLSDSERNRRSVDIALGPLLGEEPAAAEEYLIE